MYISNHCITEREELKFKERRCALVFACCVIEEIAEEENSILAFLVTNPFLFKEFWMDYAHSLYSDVGTSIFGFGNNSFNQLGSEGNKFITKPETISALTGKKILQIACGSNHSLALLETGKLFGFGNNKFGQLGLGSFQSEISTPTEIKSLRHVVEIACGSNRSIAQTGLYSNEVFVFGSNTFGQLGIGENISIVRSPVKIKTLGTKVSRIFSGYFSSFAILENKQVYSWGSNLAAQLGLGDRKDKFLPECVNSLSGKNIISIACGSVVSLALTESGEVLFAGDKNFAYQPDLNIQATFEIVNELLGKKITSVSCGSWHCFAITDSNEVFGFGDNRLGQLGIGNKETKFSPIEIKALSGKRIVTIAGGEHFTVALTDFPREAFGWGDNYFSQIGIDGNGFDIPTKIATLEEQRIISISCGSSFTLALSE